MISLSKKVAYFHFKYIKSKLGHKLNNLMEMFNFHSSDQYCNLKYFLEVSQKTYISGLHYGD